MTQTKNVCKSCGKEFSPKRKTQKYCNDDCRVAYYKEHYFVVQQVEKTCPNCGVNFTTTMPKKQVYCKPECREEAAKIRAGAAVAQADAERTTHLTERYATFERDGFKCTVCGRGVKEGAVLDILDSEDGPKTVCTECKEGKEAK